MRKQLDDDFIFDRDRSFSDKQFITTGISMLFLFGFRSMNTFLQRLFSLSPSGSPPQPVCPISPPSINHPSVTGAAVPWPYQNVKTTSSGRAGLITVSFSILFLYLSVKNKFVFSRVHYVCACAWPGPWSPHAQLYNAFDAKRKRFSQSKQKENWQKRGKGGCCCCGVEWVAGFVCETLPQLSNLCGSINEIAKTKVKKINMKPLSF